MNKDEIREYLKESLQVRVTITSGWYGEKTLHTRVYLEDDMIYEYDTMMPDHSCEKSGW